MIQVQHSSAIYHCYNQYIVMGRVKNVYKGRFQYTLCCCGLDSEVGVKYLMICFLIVKENIIILHTRKNNTLILLLLGAV